ncbi:hypothetical protein PDJAM_G00103620 [Pangasius djambal]|uniref:Uncharacterized protein n=1 Tax=Pangasius djambal TaxID=1691987 RepID=A0ACC5Y0U8_9TELE|nr:hypothetical protein [Pangasius djambal]
MSVPIFSHGRSGNVCGVSGSQGLPFLFSLQAAHLDTVFSICADILGQYRMALPLALHFTIPRCDSYILLSNSLLSCCGTMNHQHS